MINSLTKTKNIYLFIAIPALLNLLLMGFYFSGVDFLQQIVSPNNGFLTRESGLLEQLQNICLLSIIAIFSYCFINRIEIIEKVFFFLLSIVFVFLFLEEIDYGISLYEFLTNKNFEGEVRNWHNESDYGDKQNVTHFKKLIDVANALWFIVLPLVVTKINVPFIKSLAPHRFFIIGFLMTLAYSNVAHFLDDAGFSVIDGVRGSLTSNISEFRECNNYYLYLLYSMQLIKTNLTLRLK